MIDATDISYYTSPMAMGKRKRDRQPTMWATTTDLPTAASHPFCRRLNQLLREHGFDDFVEAQCADFYAETMGRRWSLQTVCTYKQGLNALQMALGEYPPMGR